MLKDEEYIFKTAPLIDWQKWLNQWKHEYLCEIVHCTIHTSHTGISTATILLHRWKS